MHYMTPLLLAGVLILAQSASAQGGVETLHEACQDAVVKADYPTAEQVCQAAVAAAEKEAQDTPLHAMTLNNLAELYRAQGHYAQAEPLFERALAIQEHTLGPTHPSVVSVLNNLARLYYAQGHHAQAEPLFKRVLAIQEHTLGPAHPLTKAARESLVDIRAKMRSNGGP
jgi:tetratricopeptide (TPR) repeat protein